MTLHPHWGHGPVLRALARARLRGSLPQALLIHGPPGVGKQHLALWLGQLLLCPSPGGEGPCGSCTHCRWALRLEHPDLHWHFPLPRPEKASTPEKLADALEEARALRLASLRENPLQPSVSGEARAHYLAAVRLLRRRAYLQPSRGEHQVFILGEADALAVQEDASEAANALLKLLEEPPPRTTFILTSVQPGRLLPTLRSRTTPLHLPPLSRKEVAAFLEEVVGIPEAEARRLASLSRGSIGRALGFRRGNGEDGPLEQLRRAALQLLEAALAPSPAGAFRAALEFSPRRARDLANLLDALEELLVELAEASAGAPEPSPAFPVLSWNGDPRRVAAAAEKVWEARLLAQGNVNPQLLVGGLLMELRQILGGAPAHCP